MRIKEEMIQDMDLRIPKILVHGNRGIIHNVKSIEQISDDMIAVNCGKQAVSVQGSGLSISYLEGEQLMFVGLIEAVEFHRKKGQDG